MKPVALVTGASGGLGAALAVGLARDGFDVALHYGPDEADALQTLETVCACGGVAEMFQANLAHESEAQELADIINAHFGRLDVLVNNAGDCQERKGLDLTEAEWLAGLNSTVTQTFFTTRAMLPLLRQSERKRVINIGDASCAAPARAIWRGAITLAKPACGC
jgi:3-oxoacyl-[acyl-carrier protein] reductase